MTASIDPEDKRRTWRAAERELWWGAMVEGDAHTGSPAPLGGDEEKAASCCKICNSWEVS